MTLQNSVVIYGAGGHGRVVADMAAASGWNVIGFIDDKYPLLRTKTFWPILGSRAWLQRDQARTFQIALGIGGNSVRREIGQFLGHAGFRLATVISSHAVVSRSALMHAGAVVMPGAVINADAEVGAGSIVNTCAVIEHDVRLGEYVHISPNAALGGGVRVGDLTHVGLGASVVHGIQIGAYSLIGSGAVVTHSIPEGVVAYGVPARIVGPCKGAIELALLHG